MSSTIRCWRSARSVSASSSGLSSTSRMTLLSAMAVVLGALQSEIEGGPSLHRALGPHLAAVSVDDAPHGSQPDAAALEFGRLVEPLEGAEQSIGVGHVEPSTVVADEERRRAGMLGCAELDTRAGILARE